MKYWTVLALCAASAPLHAEAIALAPFSRAEEGRIPPAWQPAEIGKGKRPTEYSITTTDGRQVLRAHAQASASALVHRLHADLARTPWLAWSWRVDALVAHGELESRRGDDFPARIYVVFDVDESTLPLTTRAGLAFARAIHGSDVPAAALCYVWDNRHPVGHTAWNAYTDRVRMIVADSGSAKLGQWLAHRRNLAEDFRLAFGVAAPAVKAIVLAADTDNTGATTTAWFGDLRLLANEGDEK